MSYKDKRGLSDRSLIVDFDFSQRIIDISSISFKDDFTLDDYDYQVVHLNYTDKYLSSFLSLKNKCRGCIFKHIKIKFTSSNKLFIISTRYGANSLNNNIL